jgi:hypothetical protein
MTSPTPAGPSWVVALPELLRLPAARPSTREWLQARLQTLVTETYAAAEPPRQSHSSGSAAKAVDVEYSDLRADTNWTLYAFTEGRVDPGALHSALEATVNKLRHQYELRAPE